MTGSSAKKARPPLRIVSRPKTPVGVLFRMFVLGSVAVIASAWAIWHHYTAPHVSMLREVPAASSPPWIDIEP